MEKRRGDRVFGVFWGIWIMDYREEELGLKASEGRRLENLNTAQE